MTKKRKSTSAKPKTVKKKKAGESTKPKASKKKTLTKEKLIAKLKSLERAVKKTKI